MTKLKELITDAVNMESYKSAAAPITVLGL